MSGNVTIALAGDVMLGRLLNDAIPRVGFAYPWGDMIDTLNSADLFLINLECALTAHLERWRDGSEKAFYFRADPAVLETLRIGGVDFASLANNHAGDFRDEGLLETVRLLDSADIQHAGAGADLAAAREPARLQSGGLRVAVVSFADYPVEWAATESAAGINYTQVSLEPKKFERVRSVIAEARQDADFVIFSIHWGPNMTQRPQRGFPEFAHAVIDAGADVFWGHSAHVVQGVEIWHGKPILYDTGDFVDDYAVDGQLRNDLGALFVLNLRSGATESIDILPTRIDNLQVNRAQGADRELFLLRFGRLCGEMGTSLTDSETGARITVLAVESASREPR